MSDTRHSIANADDALDLVEEWYAARTPEGEELPTIGVMRTMESAGGWVIRCDFEDRVSVVRVGPRGGLACLFTLADEQLDELR